MHPFSALRSEKQDTSNTTVAVAPHSLPSHGESSSSSPDGTSPSSSSSTFPLRIKLNTFDYVLNVTGSATVGTLKRCILQRHLDDANTDGDGDDDHYLRLIVRGRMMAPDSATLDSFAVSTLDVIHAVLAKEGRGAQARMLRRLNQVEDGRSGSRGGVGFLSRNFYGHADASVAAGGGGGGGGGDSLHRLWRRIGIDASGVVVSRSHEEESDDSSEEDTDHDEAHGHDDVEANREGGRRVRERRGFDRLRSTGMTREEVNTIRLYFARSVDRYIERRRILIRASNQMRNRLNRARDSSRSAHAPAAVGGGGRSRRDSRDRLDTSDDSTNSLLDVELSEEGGSEDDGGGEGEGGRDAVLSTGRTPQVNADLLERGSNHDATNPSMLETPAVEEGEGEEILLDRRRMEDEWMSTQGPYSEFRMNLNTSNPLLLAAISGNNTTNPSLISAMGTGRRGGLGPGLFFRRNHNNNGTLSASNNANGGLSFEAEDDDDDLMFGSLGPNGAFLRNSSANSAFHPYIGPLPSAGTDKDFVWGFILGFFVGFIMLFWVWMPTVPHKQKIGIICGISFQLGLNLLRKSGEGGVSI